MRLVLFQPDIPQNAGALMRLASCLGVGLDLVEPCGFVLGDRRLKRAGLDYGDRAELRLVGRKLIGAERARVGRSDGQRASVVEQLVDFASQCLQRGECRRCVKIVIHRFDKLPFNII